MGRSLPQSQPVVDTSSFEPETTFLTPLMSAERPAKRTDFCLSNSPIALRISFYASYVLLFLTHDDDLVIWMWVGLEGLGCWRRRFGDKDV